MQINFKSCALNILLSLVILIPTNIIFLPLNKAALLTLIQVICISVVSWGLYIYQKWQNKKFWDKVEGDCGDSDWSLTSTKSNKDYSDFKDYDGSSDGCFREVKK